MATTKKKSEVLMHLQSLISLISRSGTDSADAERFALQLVLCSLAESNGLFVGNTFSHCIEVALEQQDTRVLKNTLTECFSSLPDGLSQPALSLLPVDAVECISELVTAAKDGHFTVDELAECYERSITLDCKKTYGAFFTDTQATDKLLNALFLDKLRSETSQLQSKEQAQLFIDNLASEKILDASCGCGNILFRAYTAMNEIAASVAADFGVRNTVNVNQFFGIEINENSVIHAKAFMCIQRRICELYNSKATNSRLPLLEISFPEQIECADATTAEYPSGITYIVGNPPFAQCGELAREIKLRATYLGDRLFDIALIWVQRTLNYLQLNGCCKAAALILPAGLFTAEQGRQFWASRAPAEPLFAYEPFDWNRVFSDAPSVSCAIIGFARQSSMPEKKRFYRNNGEILMLPHISWSLRADDIISRNLSYRNNLPLIDCASGVLTTVETIPRSELRSVRGYIPFVNADDLFRYGKSVCYVSKETNAQIVDVNKGVVIIPRHCSENRRYIPIFYFSEAELPRFAVNYSVLYVNNADITIAAMLQSAVHQDYAQRYGSRLGSRYRYTIDVYRTFPAPALTEEQKIYSGKLFAEILSERKKNKDCTVGKLYNRLPPTLYHLHLQLDEMFDEIMFNKSLFSRDVRAQMVADLSNQ